MIPFVAAALALGCVWASVRRFRLCVAPTALSAQLLAQVCTSPERVRALARAVRGYPEATWENELFDAFSGAGRARVAAVNEALSDLELLLNLGSEVPKTCARISVTGGLLLAAVGFVRRASQPDVGLLQWLPDALGAAISGICGGFVCFLLHARSQEALRRRREDTDRLVARLDRFAPGPAESAAGPSET